MFVVCVVAGLVLFASPVAGAELDCDVQLDGPAEGEIGDSITIWVYAYEPMTVELYFGSLYLDTLTFSHAHQLLGTHYYVGVGPGQYLITAINADGYCSQAFLVVEEPILTVTTDPPILVIGGPITEDTLDLTNVDTTVPTETSEPPPTTTTEPPPTTTTEPPPTTTTEPPQLRPSRPRQLRPSRLP
jgi:hypothetical protein